MISFTQDERNQLIIACVIFSLVELSLFISIISNTGPISQFLLELIIIILLSVPLFLLHELAHKFSAQKFGFPARFYLDQNLAIMSLISILFPFKLIAPGAVVFYGNPSKKTEASIAMAGPIINIALGGILLAISFFLTSNWYIIVLIISKFSFDLALFNLLPFFILDGAKIYQWNRETYGVIFAFTLIIWLFHPIGFF
jgi:Zn-dependent protease